MFSQPIGHRRHRHFAAQQHYQGFKEQREAAAFPCPRHHDALDAVLRAVAARYARFQQALILEKVQMPPLLGARVMRRAQLTALRAPKFLAALKIQLQNQPLGLPFKSTFHNLPPRLELQGRRKQRFWCHRSHPVPPRQGFTRAGNEALVPCLPRAPRAPYQNKIIPIYQLSTAGSPK
jgi:hypothetical protein